ncbi:Flp pilus assembly protein CpaB [Sphingomonas sp. BN140010]|uniref:Flp pilus assembly protein CpaB n=1 Tax=Sphingomonas arvum TaxID=2992113 RepID=A0ABT3JDU3_9SPHN|nr:Flp pilus assembly protein CpaB [Sphingomonas sp. BN140010]MCW3797174.1 Flp pilus assembly protein CpaB [Sphingomonas sp. BN140010]
MRRQTLIALGIAIFAGLIAVYLANTFLTATEERNNKKMTPVAVAAVPLQYGAQLTPDKIKFVEYPASAIPAGSFTNAAELIPANARRVALRPMAINEPIMADKVTGKGQGASIAALLADGKRAVSVRIDDVSGVAGFVQPNDAVDVLITRSLPSANNGQVTDVLLQNVRVLATDQQADNPEGKPSVARTATLEVDPLDAQKLALAQQAGSLSLVLRKPGAEQQLTAVQTVNLNDLRYGYTHAPGWQPVAQARPVRRVSAPVRRPAPRPVAAATPAPPLGTNVEVVRGTKGDTYTVGDYAG